ncbi:uncharacterized protein PV09_06772 [Verruconis gallopava]|uniref:Sensitive to high expression protein 9, mitochondrial n=1 Tax=Verruconis gallopava TaxID=253628 RepID=A0A0D2A5A8_9PEZI|nr:uncharacterized protein PV09_06772 [Verruconis gallopava]KIW01933.1 hypothetical protein PV09_06772 [Verruconis gallopava]
MRSTLHNAWDVAARTTLCGTRSAVSLRHRQPFICRRCQHLAGLKSVAVNDRYKNVVTRYGHRRGFSWTAGKRQDEVKKVDAESPSTSGESEQSSAASNGTVSPATRDQLPSHREEIRWRVSKYMNKVMDNLMPKLALASQRINTYTGTDYSGIEALRKEIIEQEKLVKFQHAQLVEAKEALESARSAESLSRKEVVSLLERRHSWSDTDLERYMSLIRSEHLNDQAVQSAKDRVADAEAALAAARNKLEKMERMQYHEEQIWSDTIRRNSTWVTFGLMGVNILLLLVTMGVVEPWRRKRMVREIKAALEESRTLPPAATLAQPSANDEPGVAEVVEDDSHHESEPNPMPIEVEAATGFVATSTVGPAEPVLDTTAPGDLEPLAPQTSIKEKVVDLFSERNITVRMVDMSTVALEGAVVGALITAILLGLLRPR